MDNAKFEQLITMITNENEEQAKALFHDIVVQKSREIYESMMDEENLSGGVGDLLDEINVEEEGLSEEDDDFGDDFGDEEEISLDGEEEFGGEEGEEGLEDRVVSLEDKLDELMAEFEELMADEEGEEEHMDGENDPDFGEEGEEDFGDEGEEDFGDEEEEPLAEAVALQNVKGLYGSKIGGDNGSNAKSPTLTKPKVVSTGANPVKFTGSPESVPTSPKNPSNAYTKGETSVKGAGSFKNSPGQKNADPAAAPKPTTSQASGVNNKSVVESRKRK